MKIALIDYGAGNLRSVQKALDCFEVKTVISDREEEIKGCDGIILPGVGAFAEAKRRLDEKNLTELLKNEALSGKPFLGICLGMQLLFDMSYEFGQTEGLGLIPGKIDLIRPKQDEKNKLKIPHMGWNSLEYNVPSPLLDGVAEGEWCYFVHSFMAYTERENVAAYVDYGCKVPALVIKDNIHGAQFHPEKSGETGLKILKNFIDQVKGGKS